MPREDTQFKEGEVNNPNGRPTMTQEEKLLAKLARTEVKKIIAKYLMKTEEEILQLMHGEDAQSEMPYIEKIVLAIVVAAYKKGDYNRLSWFLDQLNGKQTSKFEVGGIDGKLPNVNIIIPSNGREKD